jgi:hypothetical protein
VHFPSAVRSDDLDRFYCRTEGVILVPEAGGSGMSQTRASKPPECNAIIDLNVSPIAPPSPTPATIDTNHNGLQICSPPPNPNPNGSPPRPSLLGNWVIHQVIWLTSSSTRYRPATMPQGVITDECPSDLTVWGCGSMIEPQ